MHYLELQNTIERAFAVNGKCAKMGARAVAEMVLDVTLIGLGEMVVNGVSSAF